MDSEQKLSAISFDGAAGTNKMGVRIVNENQTGRGKKHDARLEAGL
jgi:hypothetical protein